MFMKTTLMAGMMIAALGTGMAEARGGPGGQVDFETLDSDGDGQITQAEMQAHGAARFAAADTDGDGFLSVEEMTARGREHAAQRAAKMLERRDANGDGQLSAAELAPPEGREGRMFARVDTDGDGAISKAEFDAAKAARHGRRRGQGSD